MRILCFLFLYIGAIVSSEKSVWVENTDESYDIIDDEAFRSRPSNSDIFLAKAIRFAYQVKRDPELMALWDQQVAAQYNPTGWQPVFPPFECDTSATYDPAQSVHQLRPSDIKVVAAMGDSITAGNGVLAVSIGNVFWECRGESFSVGGDNSLEEGVITITNVLRKFNPDVKGFSTCRSMEYNKKFAWMNLAQPGADNTDMEEQARNIVLRASNDQRIDFENDWKMVTLFIGGNDFCKWCDFDYSDNIDPDQKPEAYRRGIQRGLDILHRHLPRTFVNLVPMFDITPLNNMSSDPICALSHLGFCECAYINATEMKDLQMDYYHELQMMVDSGRYDTADNFTVVLQPMFVESKPPIDPVTGKYYRDFFSPDCFHPNQKAHQTFAFSLWNTMLMPVSEKPLDVQNLDNRWYCPTQENPYLGTRLNGAQPMK